MRWGIVGTGTIARAFAAALARVPGATLAAVASRDAARARAFGAAFGATEVAADAGALAALPAVDVVYVATPHHRHEPDALAVIAHGKPVLVEKPLGLDAASAARIADAARAAGVFAMEGMWSLCLPVYRDAFARIAAGEIGAVREIAASFATPEPWDPASRFWDAAQGGGALLDRGVYLVHLALALMEAPAVVAAEVRLAESGVDASAAFVLADAAGRRAVLSAGLDSLAANQVTVQGTAGRCLFLEPVPCPPAAWFRHHAPRPAEARGPAPRPGGRLAGLRAALGRQPLLRRVERGLMRGARFSDGGLEQEIAEVERCLAAGSPESPLVPLDRSVAALALLDAVRERGREQGPGRAQ
jgi:predicted dehydrogenase